MPHAVGPPRTIVMVVFDELPLTSLMEPGGRIDASRYPAFAGLAGDGIWYRGATAVHDSTALAVPAMLDGRYPRPGLPSDVYSHPAEPVHAAGGRLRAPRVGGGDGAVPDEPVRPHSRNHREPPLARQAGRFRRFVRGVRPTPRPALWFKHVLLPHVPWQYYPSGAKLPPLRAGAHPGAQQRARLPVPWLVKVSYQRHLLQLGMADRLLGQLIEPSARHGAVPRRARDGRRQSRDRVPRGARAADRQATQRAGPGAGADDREAAGGTPRPRGRPAVETSTSSHAPRAGPRARARGGGGAVAVRARSGEAGRVHDLPPGRHRAEHDRRPATRSNRPRLARRRAAAVRRKTGVVRERRRKESGGAVPDRPARRAGACGRPTWRARGRARTTADSAHATIDEAADLRLVDPTSRFIPGQITGTIEPHAGWRPRGRAGRERHDRGDRPHLLARGHSERGELRADGPESAFRPGPNNARVFEIVPGSGAPALPGS